MLPGILAGGVITVAMLIAWLQQLRQDWREWSQRELQVVACRERQAIIASLPALLVIQPDCDLNVAARMRHSTSMEQKRVLRVQDVRHARKLQGVQHSTSVGGSAWQYRNTGRMPSFVEVDIAPILAHMTAAPWHADDASSCSSTSSVLSDDSDLGSEEASVALALARNAAMTPDMGKQCVNAPVFQIGSPQVPGWSQSA